MTQSTKKKVKYISGISLGLVALILTKVALIPALFCACLGGMSEPDEYPQDLI